MIVITDHALERLGERFPHTAGWPWRQVKPAYRAAFRDGVELGSCRRLCRIHFRNTTVAVVALWKTRLDDPSRVIVTTTVDNARLHRGSGAFRSEAAE